MSEQSAYWERVSSEKLGDLKLFSARFDLMKNPRNGLTQKMIVLEGPDAANIVAVTNDQQILFVSQFRFGTSENMLELPGGIVDPGENHNQAALRELREETGYSGEHWTYLGNISSNPVFMTNRIHHYLAENVEQTHELHLDMGEDLKVELMPLAEVFQRWKSGFFRHPHTVNALLLFFVKKNFI
ncbi:MAG: NUDIX hydrolase [Saprospiraceae bacterium]|nr:NUDIX hydrolase [Saprospiraceae bacterium]